MFSVEPLAPTAVRDGTAENHLTRRRHAIADFRLRPLDDNENDAVNDSVADDEDASEQDDVQSERDRHNSNRSNLDEDAQDALRNEDVVHEGESDTEYFHEAETESDSDDNQSTQDAQRSVQTGATAGSDTGEGTFNLIHSKHGILVVVRKKIII